MITIGSMFRASFRRAAGSALQEVPESGQYSSGTKPVTKPESRVLQHTALALRISEERLRIAGEIIDQPLALLDEDGAVVFASAKFAALAGCEVQDVAGRGFIGLFEESGRATIHRNLKSLVPGGRAEQDAGLMRHGGEIRRIRVCLGRVDAGHVEGAAYWAFLREAPVAPSPLPRLRDGASRGRLPCALLAGQEAERKRIAAELHDGLGQMLSAVKAGIQAVSCAINGSAPPGTKLTLDTVVSTVKEAIDEVRRVSSNLRPAMLDDLGLVPTLTWFLREFQAIYQGIAVKVEILASESDVDDELRLPIFRVVQEAMNNVAKHSQATHARVRLERRAGRLLLTIADDGIGFDGTRSGERSGPAMSCGHCCSRERVEASGGEISIESAPGRGVVVKASWPALAVALE